MQPFCLQRIGPQPNGAAPSWEIFVWCTVPLKWGKRWQPILPGRFLNKWVVLLH
jgi:hypothetical protein